MYYSTALIFLKKGTGNLILHLFGQNGFVKMAEEMLGTGLLNTAVNLTRHFGVVNLSAKKGNYMINYWL